MFWRKPINVCLENDRRCELFKEQVATIEVKIKFTQYVTLLADSDFDIQSRAIQLLLMYSTQLNHVFVI
jgi:hypothetical protein